MVQHLTPYMQQAITGVVERQKAVLRAKVMDIRSFRALTKYTALLAPKKVPVENLLLALMLPSQEEESLA